MSIDLKSWAYLHEPSGAQGTKNKFWKVVKFMKDELPPMLYDWSVEEYYANPPQVLGQHKSKSILLPICLYRLEQGVEIILSYNFHLWDVSVTAPFDLDLDPTGLFETDNLIEPHCSTLRAEQINGSYSQSKQRFTLQLASEHMVFVFCFLLKRAIKAQKTKSETPIKEAV